MKHRNGFVSNSSSSSFVVAFSKVPESVEELRQLLFGDDDWYGCYDERFSTTTIAEKVFHDLKKQYECEDNEKSMEQPLNPEAIMDIFQRGYLDTDPKSSPWKSDLSREERDNIYDDHIRRIGKHRINLAMDFISNHRDKVIFSFSYADGDGAMFSAMEHGGLFRKLPHVRFSEH